MHEMAENIFTLEARVKFYGSSIQTRMAVIKLEDGSLLVYSPIFLTTETKNQLDALGEVKYVISPNKIHNQALSDYVTNYPDAGIYASPGLPERRPDIKYKAILKDTPEKEWEKEFDQVLTKGNAFFSEALFYHRSSKTLLVCDFVENMNRTTASNLILFRLFGVKENPWPHPSFVYTRQRKKQHDWR